MTRPIAVDLFAGAGGLSLGFEQAGFDIMASVEIDPIHCSAHKYNFPMCKTICRSVVDVTGEYVRKVSGIGEKEIDVVIGGAPCQGFSLIGKRALDDDRNKLVYHYVRLVLELKPKYFIFENVKGLTVGKHKQFLVEIMDAFKDGGYDVVSDYKVLNAADYGVPQDRRRLFLMGGRKGLTLPSYPEPLSIKTTVGEAIGDVPDAEKYPELWGRDWVDAKFGEQSLYSSYLHGVGKDPSDFSYPRIFNKDKLTCSLLTDHSDTSRGRFVETLPNTVEPISRFKKLSMNGLCNTLRAGTASDRGAFTSPRPIHPIYPRVITVREAARLHSYPDWFRFHVTKWHGFRQVGNSVPPMLARSVGLQIMKVLGVTPKKPTKKIKLGDESLVAISMSDAASMFGVSSNVIAKRIKIVTRRLFVSKDKKERTKNRYHQLVEKIFFDKYVDGDLEVFFERLEINSAAKNLGIDLPSNVGDVIYSIRFRTPMPESILLTQPEGKEWVIELAGRSKYRFRLVTISRILPNPNMVAIKIPDNTPEIITGYYLDDEQALLAKVRYNRLIDIFLGITTYSLQNHLRTTVKGIGQIEIDELYVGIDKYGCHYIIPVQAKGGTDQISMVQTSQDTAWCEQKYPNVRCRAISAQFVSSDLIALFELKIDEGQVKLIEERHYKLVPAKELDSSDISNYRMSV